MNKDIRTTAERATLWTLVAVATALFFWMIAGFLMPIFMAAVLAILFYPLYLRLLSALPRYPAAASMLTVASAILFVGIPLYVMLYLLAGQAFEAYRLVADDPHGALSSLMAALPTDFLARWGVSLDDVRVQLASVFETVSSGAFSAAAAATSGTLAAIVKSIIALYLMYFFLKDGARFLGSVSTHVPLPDAQERVLFDRFVSTVRAVVKGVLIVALLQGLIGGALFALVGISQPVLWGAVMFFLALIPLGGPMLVWIPAALILFTTGHEMQALVLALGGTFIIGTIDNFLRPVLVGRDAAMPNALVFVSVLAGIASFGVTGLVMGPVIAALFLAVWELLGDAS